MIGLLAVAVAHQRHLQVCSNVLCELGRHESADDHHPVLGIAESSGGLELCRHGLEGGLGIVPVGRTGFTAHCPSGEFRVHFDRNILRPVRMHVQVVTRTGTTQCTSSRLDTLGYPRSSGTSSQRWRRFRQGGTREGEIPNRAGVVDVLAHAQESGESAEAPVAAGPVAAQGGAKVGPGHHRRESGAMRRMSSRRS